MNKTWIALFSQTGGEIVEISRALGRWPDVILTNKRPEHLREINSEIPRELLIEVPNRPTVEDYKKLIPEGSLVTLHGWLRILPKEICERYKIYNGHPGLISRFEHLKGKDPQIRAFKEKLPVMGCVIHKVTAGVDEGRIIAEEKFNSVGITEEQMWRTLKDRSLYLWINFLHKVL